jgi:hypothetical protein
MKMKKVMLIVAAMLLIGSAASAQDPGGRIEYFADTTPEAYCLYGVTGFGGVHVYVFVYPPPVPPPGEVGWKTLTFGTNINYVGDPTDGGVPPPHWVISSLTYSGTVGTPTLAQGDFFSGLDVTWGGACFTGDPTYVMDVFMQSFTYPGDPMYVCPWVNRNTSNLKLLADCDNIEWEPSSNYCVYMNTDPCPEVIGTEDTSWGAIKSIFK